MRTHPPGCQLVDQGSVIGRPMSWPISRCAALNQDNQWFELFGCYPYCYWSWL